MSSTAWLSDMLMLIKRKRRMRTDLLIQHARTRVFKISAVDDRMYGLTGTNDSVGPWSISWGILPETEEYIQARNTALILILASVTFIVAIIAVLVLSTSTQKKNPKTKGKKQAA